MKMSPLALTGIMLWWAEGTKSRRDKRWKSARSYPIELTNTNAAIIKVFVDFLRLELKVPNSKLRLQIQIHEGDDKEDLEKYWSIITDIPRASFHKTIVRPKGNKVGKSKGTCKIRFADKQRYLELESLLTAAMSEIYEQPKVALKKSGYYEKLLQSATITDESPM